MKKWISWMLILLLLIGCTPAVSPETEPKEASTESGDTRVIEVTGSGHSDGLKLKVTFSGDTITEVEVVEHNETPGVSDLSLVEIPKAIVEHNSVQVDAITGATETSEGIKDAVKNAIAEAGLNLEDFEKEVHKTTEGKQVTYDVDVVVAGGGIAGLAAGVEAAQAGAKVLLLGKMPVTGGSTMMSGGLILGAESSIAKKLGNQETWQVLADYWYEVGEEQVSREFIDPAAKSSGENIDWMMEQGVQMKEEVTKLHSSHDFAFGHKVAGYDDVPSGGGVAMTGPLTQKIIDLGGEVLLSTPATELIVKDGVVVGIKATNDNGDDIIVNAKAVILATGGFGASDELMKEHSPFLKSGAKDHNGNIGNTGDGLKMAQSVNAKMNFLNAGNNPGINIPTFYGYGEGFNGLYVTPAGERFIDESVFQFVRVRKLLDYDVNDIWAITDQGTEAEEAAVEMGTAIKADSVEELAKLIEADPATLQETVEKYNAAASSGVDEEFGKNPEFLKSIEGPTIYAIKVTLGNSGTLGGMVTTVRGEALDANDQVIEGLYAAGELANGHLYYKGYPGSGTAIALYLHYGREAGKAAADFAK